MDIAKLQVELGRRATWLHSFIAQRIPGRLATVVSAEDIVQEVWISAFESFEKDASAAPRELNGWLIGIARHRMADALRHATRVRRGGGKPTVRGDAAVRESCCGLFAQLASPQRTPSRTVSAAEAARAVRIAMASLPVDYRCAVQMRFIEGRSNGEIAAIMDKSSAAVNSLVWRGLQQLRDRLGEACRYISAGSSASSRQPRRGA